MAEAHAIRLECNNSWVGTASWAARPTSGTVPVVLLDNEMGAVGVHANGDLIHIAEKRTEGQDRWGLATELADDFPGN